MDASRYDLMVQNECPPRLFDAMLDCLSGFGLSPAVVWPQLCAIASMLTQGVADVLWPNGRRAPLGVSGLVVGPSGCGKSVIYQLLMEAIEEYIAAASTPSGLAALLIEDATLPAVMAHLKESQYGALFSDEAGSLVHLQGASSTLAKLIDGTPVRTSRVTSDPIRLVGHRFVMLQALQPQRFEASRLFTTAQGHVGLINRFLLAAAMPTLGSLHHLVLPEALTRRHRLRARELLDATFQNARSKPAQLPALQLSPEARQFLDYVAEQSRRKANDPTSPLAKHGEYVTRHAERILRLAGAIHIYNHGLEGLSRPIALETIQFADQIGCWSIQAFQHLAYRPTQAQKDAHAVELVLRHHQAMTGQPYVKLADLRRHAANMGLTRRRIDQALPELVNAGHGYIVPKGKMDYVHLRFGWGHIQGYPPLTFG
jgi:energy-coupling factor transporter ATP-binding protein EcfA2